MNASSAQRHPDPAGLCGRIIDGRYLLERVVGSGGFGVVYRATHLRFDSPIAVKVLRIGSRHDEAERERFVERFVAEGKVLWKLGALHPSIVRVFEAGTVECADGSIAPYLAMEWLDGLPLDREIERRRARAEPSTSLVEVIHLLEPAAQALAAAHRARVAHRDIKPANIFLCEHDGRVVSKLVDFGLAKAVHESTTTTSLFDQTGHRETSFTPSYGAPEQWLRRLGATGPWTDVHALALVCVELLSGQRAFHGDAAQLMAACLDRAFRPTPRVLGCDVPDAVEQAFLKALAVDPRERFANAADFWRALRAAAGIVDGPERASISLAGVHAAAEPSEVTAATQSRQLGELASDASEAPVAVPSRTKGGRRAQIAALVSLALLSGLFFSTAPRSTQSRSVRAQPAEPAKPVIVAAEPTPRATQPTPTSPLVASAPTVSTPARPVEAIRKRPVAARASAPLHPQAVSTPVPSSIASAAVAEDPGEARPDDILRHDQLTRRR